MELKNQGVWPHVPPEPCSDLVSHAALALLPIIPLFLGALPRVRTEGEKPAPWRLMRTWGL